MLRKKKREKISIQGRTPIQCHPSFNINESWRFPGKWAPVVGNAFTFMTISSNMMQPLPMTLSLTVRKDKGKANIKEITVLQFTDTMNRLFCLLNQVTPKQFHWVKKKKKRVKIQ